MKSIHVQIVQHLKPGGIETMCLDFCQQTDVRVFVISLEGTLEQSLRQWPRLEPFRQRLFFLNKQPGWSLTCLWRLIGLLRRLKPSVVHTHHIGPMIYGGAAARWCQVAQWVHTEHDAWHLNDRKHRFLVGRWFAWFKPILVADALAVSQRLISLYPKTPCHVIENGINTQQFTIGSQQLARRQLGLPSNTHIVGCAARLHPVKGHLTLIQALKLLPSNVHLALAGSGELLGTLQAFCAKQGLADRVHFLGHLDEMALFYQALDVFCLASDHEGMPLSALEAQACGKYVVLTDVGGCRQCVGPDCGLLVPPKKPDLLANALAKMLQQSACTEPRRYVVQKRSLLAMLQRYQQLLHRQPMMIGGSHELTD